MGEVKFHIALPIFIMRQLVRHRMASLNEYSGRYSEMSNEFYIPSLDYILPQSTTNRQGRAGDLSEQDRQSAAHLIEGATDAAYVVYRTLLGKQPSQLFSSEFTGISNELARMVLPVANYTECYWKMDLHNFFHFAKLRMDSHAQQEIRDFATTMFDMVKPLFPLATEAFEDYVYHARTLSRMDIVAIKDMLTGNFINNPEQYGMSKREFTELVEFFRPTAQHSRNISAT